MLAHDIKEVELAVLPSRRRRNRRNSLTKSEMYVNVSTKSRDKSHYEFEASINDESNSVILFLD